MSSDATKETQVRSITVGDQKGGPTIRLPPEWKVRAGLRKIIPISIEWCEHHQLWHTWILMPGEPAPLCPENVMICPCGCGKAFRYNKTEQKSLRDKLGLRR